jgi:nitrous oxide reductase accessory protein NosL
MRAALLRARAIRAACITALVCVIGCGAEEIGTSSGHNAPSAIGQHEDPVCGMLVRDQSAPRAQVFHRDGTSFFLCSIGDLLVHLSAPSPHGAVFDAFVEVLGADEDPATSHTGPHDWIEIGHATYVVGVPRSGVMGEPILAYASVEDARRVASSVDGVHVLDFDGLERWWQVRQSTR